MPAVSTPESQTGFWRGVRQEALAGIVVLAVGSAGAGIFYLCYTVPTKLDDVLSNQQVIQKKLGDVEDKVIDHDVRLIKLELAK